MLKVTAHAAGSRLEKIMRVEVVDEAHLVEWQAFVDRHLPYISPYHHAGWHTILKECFAVVPYYLRAVDTQGAVQGILPLYFSKSLLLGPHLASMYGGAVCADPAAAEALFDEALRLRDRLKARYLYVKGGAFPSAQPTLAVNAVCTRLRVQPDAAQWLE
jgi:hypothetical protein